MDPVKKTRVGVVVTLLFLVANSSPAISAAEKAWPIALHEAEILLYLLPVAHELRSQGMDVGWELQEQNRDRYPKEDYYVFWVINAKRTGTGSVTISYYAVNKHTADVWDTVLEELVSSPELNGVQEILRRAHDIDEQLINSYRPKMP